MLKFTDYAVQDMVDMMKDEKDPMAKKSGYNPSGSLSLSYDPPPKEEQSPQQPVKSKKTTNPSQSFNTYEPSSQLRGDDIALKEPSILHQKKQPTTAKFEVSQNSKCTMICTISCVPLLIHDTTCLV